jgi:outer membrane lipoprotein LolB
MRLTFALCALVLAACAGAPPPRPLLAPADHESLLRGLDGFSLNGRAVVKAGNEGGTPSLAWQQRAEHTTIRLSGTFGLGSLVVSWQPGELRLTGSRGEEFLDAEAEQVLVEQLGFVPPFQALRYWMLGLAAPGEPPSQQTVSESGRITGLVQQQWDIVYDRWMNVAVGAHAVELPRRVIVTREDLKLTVFVERWQL